MATPYDDLAGLYGVGDSAAVEQRPDWATRDAPMPPPAPVATRPAPAVPLDERSYGSPMADASNDLELARQADARFEDMGFPGEPMPAVDPADQMLQGAAAHANEAAQLRAIADQRTQWSAPNPVYPSTQRYTGTMLGDDGLLAQQESAAMQHQEAQRMEAATQAQVFEQRAAQLRDQAIDHKAREFERQRQLDEAQANQRAALKSYEDAATQVREAQAYDPDKWWENKSTSGKITSTIALILGGIGFGGAGRPELAMQLRQQIMQPELEKQKEVYRRMQDQVGAAGDLMGAQGNLYAQTMARVQDERQADLIVQSAMLEALQAEAEGMLARAGVQTMTGEQQVFMTDLQQQIAQNKMQLEILSATTPKMVGGSAYALAPGQRAALNREADRQDKRAEKFEDIEMGVYKDRSIDAPKEARAAALKAAGGLTEADNRRFEQRKYIEKESRPLRAEQRLIDEFLGEYEEKGEIPGLAWGVGWTPERLMTDAQKQAKERLRRVIMVRLRRESGAAISEQELGREADNMLDNANDEDDIFNLLRDRRAEAQHQIDLIERAPDEASVEEFTRSKSAPRSALPTGGTGVADPVRWEP